MRIAAIQMVSGSDIDNNLRAAEKLLADAASAGSNLAVLPENFACYGRGDLRDEGERESCGEGPLLPFLQDQARRLGLWIVAGTIPLVHGRLHGGLHSEAYADSDGEPADGRRVYAASCVFDDSGICVGRYDKSHLFDAHVQDGVGAYRESRWLCPGSGPEVVATPWGKLGLSVCYDLRFPEHYQQLREQGAQILCVPSAFTHTTGHAHWNVLLRARAIENQCFVVAANQGGWHDDKRRSYGHSTIIHPWGNQLAGMEEGEGVIVSDIDMDELKECRERMPMRE